MARDRWFYNTRGQRTKVEAKEFDRRVKIQAKAIERHGNVAWVTRRGRILSVSSQEAATLERKRETGRRAARIQWAPIREQKRQRQEQEDLRVRIYSGPSADVTTTADLAKFRANLYDYARTAIANDGRTRRLCVEAVLSAVVHTPTGSHPVMTTTVPMLFVEGDAIDKLDPAAMDSRIRTLLGNVQGLLASYLGKERKEEVKGGKVISGSVVDPGDTTGAAKRGFSAELSSKIRIRGVKSRGQC